jgi:hypothetical protein
VPVSAALGVVFVACAYYNGLYNANRLAADAVRAGREGRTGEARSLWAQAAVKAESVATRFPTSGHRDDALLLWGRALAETDNCARAIRPLVLAVDSSPDPAVETRARLILGGCYVQRRRAVDAIATLTRLVDSPEPEVAMQARLWSGRAELSREEHAAAIEHLRHVPPDSAAFDVSAAMLAVGDIPGAVEALGTVLDGRYDEAHWRAALDALATHDRAAAGSLASKLVGRGDLTDGQRGRLLLDDGNRWQAVRESDRANARYREAAIAAADSVEGGVGEVYVATAELRRAPGLAALPEILSRLEAAQRRGGEAAHVAQPVVQWLRHASSVREDSAAKAADVKMFIVAEELRDSLGAVGPALEMFLELERLHPGSVLAPKALLAAAALDPSRADSIGRILTSRYGDSPYALALGGAAAMRFAALEDSLRVVLAEQRAFLGGGRLEAAEEERGVIRR